MKCEETVEMNLQLDPNCLLTIRTVNEVEQLAWVVQTGKIYFAHGILLYPCKYCEVGVWDMMNLLDGGDNASKSFSPPGPKLGTLDGGANSTLIDGGGTILFIWFGSTPDISEACIPAIFIIWRSCVDVMRKRRKLSHILCPLNIKASVLIS